MPAQRPITFVVTSYGVSDILENNFLAAPCFRGPHHHQILVLKDYVSAAEAYNRAIDRAVNDLIVFAHQDVIFPESWPSELERALGYLETADPRWGVLGCWGATPDSRFWGYVYSLGLGVLGMRFERPIPVQTLDEIVLILRKSSGLRFDNRLPHFHLYGADICLRAAKMGMTSYAISAFCIHNTQQDLILPKEFYECCRHIKRVWKECLPIQTTCTRITKLNVALYERRLREAYLLYVGRKALVAPRAKDVARLLEQVDITLQDTRAVGLV